MTTDAMGNAAYEVFTAKVREQMIDLIREYADQNGLPNYMDAVPEAVTSFIFVAADLADEMGYSRADTANVLRGIADKQEEMNEEDQAIKH